MQTVNLHYNVPAGYSLEEFVAKVNAYVDKLGKKVKEAKKEEEVNYIPNEETMEAIREAQAHHEAYKRGEAWALEGNVDTSSVEAMLKSCGL